MQLRFALTTALALGFCAETQAGIIATTNLDTDFFADGGVSLTGPLPNFGNLADGNVGETVTLGDATLTADDNIFVGSGWSTELPNQIAIAISDRENLDISIDTGLATAFGFYFHEPIVDIGLLEPNSCNAACVESTFLISFWFDGSLVTSTTFDPISGQGIFQGYYLDQAFDLVTFDETTGGIDNEFFGEMYVIRVPEPGTLWLLGASLLGAGLMGRRKARP